MAVEGAIGPFRFFVARPFGLQPRQQRIETIQISGVNDQSYRFLGIGSDPWKLQTRSDTDTETGAWDELLAYRDLVSQGLQGITLGNEGFNIREAKVKVIRVDFGFSDTPPVRIEKGVGYTFFDGVRWICSAEWTLQWVESVPE